MDDTHFEAEHDPNHPPNLSILPSSDLIRGRSAAEVSISDRLSSSALSSFDRDSTDDIQQWGIAGRIWEAAYLFRLYLRPPSSTIEFDPPCPLFSNSPSFSVSQVQRESRGGSEGEEDGAHTPSSKQSRPVHVLELGSGVGYVGISCARQLQSYRSASSISTSDEGDSVERLAKAIPARDIVVLTDLDNVMPLMRRNAELTGFKEEEDDDEGEMSTGCGWSPCNTSPSVHLKVHDAICRIQLDYILCSDLVYFPHLLPPLLRSLITLTAPSGQGQSGGWINVVEGVDEKQADQHQSSSQRRPQSPVVMMAYKIRSYAKEEPFWSVLGIWFDVQVVSCRYLSPTSPSTVAQMTPGDDDGYGYGNVAEVTADVDGRMQSPLPRMRRRKEGAWHRFGSFKTDIASVHMTAPMPSADMEKEEDQEPSDDAYFIFIARRKASTLEYEAPSEDDKLMHGYMASMGSTDGSASKNEPLTRGKGGADFIEWALLGSMDIS